MILIGRGLDLTQVQEGESLPKKTRSIGKRSNGESFDVQLSGCVKGRRGTDERQAETQATPTGAQSPNKFTISGGYDERVPPVPIPNTEVKPLSADGTWLDTARESRSLPDSNIPQ